MKKKLVISLFCITASLTANAAIRHPSMRICLFNGGKFWNLVSPSHNISMCSFEAAVIGAETLFHFKSLSIIPDAIHSYKSRFLADSANFQCDFFKGAESIQGRDINGQIRTLCLFPDRSLIDLNTLISGPGAPMNAQLDAVLANH